ncbi:MAG: helix-turn-helix domain-containing protein [Deltaproteobacteria bacterium]|nr:helix-turn-helix domain-containing protein [Deltaproteobacteria bacterium]
MSPKACHEPTEERAGRLFLSEVYKGAKAFKLSVTQRFTAITLYKYMGDKDFCFPSQQSIAEDTALKVRQIRNILKALVGVGVIEIATRRTTGRKHGNHSYEYKFTRAFIQKSKAAISDQTKAAICDIPKRQSVTSKAAIGDTQSGNLRHSKVPQKQASRERAGAEYVRKESKKRSSNQSRKDGLTDTFSNSRKKTPADSSGLELSFDNDNVQLWNEEEGIFEAVALEGMEEESFAPSFRRAGSPACKSLRLSRR